MLKHGAMESRKVLWDRRINFVDYFEIFTFERREFDSFVCSHNVHLGSVVHCKAKPNSQETVINDSIDSMFGCIPGCRELKQC